MTSTVEACDLDNIMWRMVQSYRYL